jgi:protein-L-isoaspartate(D-aspartate) O-methyltransferase
MMNRRLDARRAHISARPPGSRLQHLPLAPLLLMLSLIGPTGMTYAQEFRADERRRMVDEIVQLARSAGEASRPALDGRVIAAMGKVPRHEFVPPEQRHAAYRNRPLPIGEGQTISQPYIVALMTDLARLESGDKVLEIGTGCGYQAAVLAEIAGSVHTIEIVDSLADRASKTLQRLKYENVHTRNGDGYGGWPEAAPFDAIVVTAAPDHIPPALVEQLKPGGRLVIPVGALFQELMVVEKKADGSTVNETIVPVRFVPLTRDAD